MVRMIVVQTQKTGEWDEKKITVERQNFLYFIPVLLNCTQEIETEKIG